jgi:hypothetical protein
MLYPEDCIVTQGLFLNWGIKTSISHFFVSSNCGVVKGQWENACFQLSFVNVLLASLCLINRAGGAEGLNTH